MGLFPESNKSDVTLEPLHWYRYARCRFLQKYHYSGHFASFQNVPEHLRSRFAYSNDSVKLAVESLSQFRSPSHSLEKDHIFIIDWLDKISSLKTKETVIDVGGGLGHIYFALKKRKQTLSFYKYFVFDTPSVITYGQEQNLSDGIIDYSYELVSASVVFFSSSLHYFDDPYSLLEQTMKSARYLAFARLPISKESEDYVSVQTAVRHDGNFIQPTWVFSIAKLIRFMAERGFSQNSKENSDKSNFSKVGFVLRSVNYENLTFSRLE